MKNGDIAQMLLTVANVLELRRENRFKVRSYRNAARQLQATHENISDWVNKGADLTALPGVGKGIARLIHEYVTTGKASYLNELNAEVSTQMAEILKSPRLNPAMVARAYKKLNINSLDALQKKLKSGEVREQLGKRFDERLRRGFEKRISVRRSQAEPLATNILQQLRGIPGVQDCFIGGSLRRKAPVINEIVVGVVSDDFGEVVRVMDNSGLIASKVETKERIKSEINSKRAERFYLNNGLLLTVVPIASGQAGLGIIEVTGSPQHWQTLKKLPRFPTIAKRTDVPEEKVYRSLGMSFIEPELRENTGEIKAATNNQLPKLITLEDIRGDLHSHTVASDGTTTILQLAKAAMKRGYEYLAISDHSQSLKLTNGLDEKRLLKQLERIDALNAKLKGFRLLKSSEVDILLDGSLDYPDAILAQLDIVTCSVHSHFNLSRSQQTKRILRALDNPYMTVLGHATGRLLLSREPYDVDFKRILKKIKERGCYIELNANPHRLDVNSEYCRMAKDMGILITISTDAHSIGELDNMRFGIDEARRGWIEPRNVLNTFPLSVLLRKLRDGRG